MGGHPGYEVGMAAPCPWRVKQQRGSARFSRNTERNGSGGRAKGCKEEKGKKGKGGGKGGKPRQRGAHPAPCSRRQRGGGGGPGAPPAARGGRGKVAPAAAASPAPAPRPRRWGLSAAAASFLGAGGRSSAWAAPPCPVSVSRFPLLLRFVPGRMRRA